MKCSHAKLGFQSGGFYVACANCSARWVATKGDRDIDLDYDRSGDNLHMGDERVKLPNE